GIGKSVTEEERAQGWAECDVFRDWFETNVMAANSELLSDAVTIMPYGMGKPKYRDLPNELGEKLNVLAGSDLLLINLIRAVFESASWPTEVLTGRYMFKAGINTRSVAGDHMEHVAKVKKSANEISHLTTWEMWRQSGGQPVN
ncbi:MAG: hypothetical protein Q9214_008088, partial [Letrouitia sp. 1 TL-2023]